MDLGELSSQAAGDLIHSDSFGVGFSQFSKYLLEDRVDLICNSSRSLSLSDGKYLTRLTKEIMEVDRGGFWQPLCFAAAVVSIARKRPSIPFVCRGSAGSSLLCYLAGISHVDPVEEGLSLDRFLGGGRDKPPDIDLDFPSELRSVLWARIREVYGDSIGFVATKLRYRSRGALREALRRCGISYDLWVSPLAIISTEQRQRVLSLASSLEGKEYGLARHCGGIVYFPNHSFPPASYCTSRARDPFVQLLLDKEDLELAGLAKLDILSNHGLSHLRAMGLESTLGKDPSDPFVGRLFSQGDTWGIVQAESPAMRKIFLNLGFSTLQGVTLALGLVRPATGGSLGKGKPSAVGRNPIERKLIYEDDITEFLAAVLGSSFSLAEFSRRTLLKGGLEAKKLLEDMERIVNRKGRDRILFRGQYWTWTQIKKQLGMSSSYAFCKAHATAYGRVVWALGYAKAHYPELFWTSFISTAMTFSMYFPWVHFERMKWELGVEVLWPGDLGIPVSRFFSYPWGVARGALAPRIEYGQGLFDRQGLQNDKGGGVGSLWEDGWGAGHDYWVRQLRAAGFWSGSKMPIRGTYLYGQGDDGGYEFRGLRALKAVRTHPLNKQEVCLFQTLGVGGLKVVEYSKVLGLTSPKLYDPKVLGEMFISARGRGLNLKGCYYLKGQ